MTWNRRVFLLLIVVIILSNFYFYSILKCEEKVTKHKKASSYHKKSAYNIKKSSSDHKNSTVKLKESFDPKTKHILFYTNFWRNKNWDIGNETVGSEHHHFDTCSVKNCVFTNNKMYLNSFADYDAIIYHTSQVWQINGIYWKMPEVRKPEQLYIAAMQE